jgi:hypothetical protein
VRAAAEEFDQAVTGSADALICNSAIWQTDFAATARAARATLIHNGVFVFNIGAEFLTSDTGQSDSVTEFPLIAAMRQIAAEEYGWTPPAEPARRRPRLNRSELKQILRTAGFAISHADRLEYATSHASGRAWLEVPVFTEGRLPGLGHETRMAVLEKAYQRLGPAPPGVSRWLAVVATAS